MNKPIRERDVRDEALAATAKGAPSFVHLKVHSAYSLLEGALPIGKIADLAVAAGFPAVGISDTNNLFGALEFSNKLAGAGVQPMIGVTLMLDASRERREAEAQTLNALQTKPAPHAIGDGHIALFAMSDQGYANLMKLVSQAHLGVGENEPVHISLEALKQHNEDVILLTGGPDGPIDRAIKDGQMAFATERLQALQAIFGDRLYVEIQRHGLASERQVEPQLLKLAYDHELAIVATNEAYFASPEDHEAHDALICISEGRYVVEDDRRRLTPEHSFKSADEMVTLFADLSEALNNTIEIAQRCAFRVLGRPPILPRFVKAEGDASVEAQEQAETDELARQAREGLDARLKVVPLAEGFSRKDYDERLEYELGIITKMKFPGYFLIVADFIKWSKAQGIPVGPGRGSGAGSLVAWVLTITDLDPLRFGLLFERFLNPERLSMPDFDIDFCQDRRDETIRYVQDKYGKDRVAQIITHGKLQARAVLRDVGRVLQMPYGQVDRLCKLVPNNPANPVTLNEAIEDEPKLQEERDKEPIVAELLGIGQKLEGLYRHASTHAAGLVIGDRPLDELVPLYRDPKSDMPVTQFNWKMVEAAGLVKFDFLGLKTLTVLQKAVELVKRSRGIDVDLAALELDDVKTYELLAAADTVGVFQLESTGMRESLKRLKPDRFDDIIAMVSLYRPGPMDNIPTYINRKHGEEPVDCFHELLEPILTETYGVIIYQEQVIQIAQVMGGYTLGQADVLRRAMGKKDKAVMAREQAKFVEGATANGVKKQDSTYIFQMVDKFAGYGFNKSHAAAYALVSYHTAYMKAHYREEFLAASMTLDKGNTDKLSVFAAEAKRSDIPLMPPSVNASGVDFSVEPSGKEDEPGRIRYSLAALKNIGESAVESIVNAREKDGPFQSLGDFASRITPKAMNKRAIETLAQAGAFDEFESDRAVVKANADAVMAMAQRMEADAAIGTTDLFAMTGGGDDAAAASPQLDLKKTTPWTALEKLGQELDAVGFYLSGHPLDQYAADLEKMGVHRFSEFEKEVVEGTSAGQLAGIVISARVRKSQRGNQFAFAMFSDATAQFEAVIFSETLSKAGDLLTPGTPVLLSVEAERDGDAVKMRVQSVAALDVAAAQNREKLTLELDAAMVMKTPQLMADLKAVLEPKPPHQGGAVELRFSGLNGVVEPCNVCIPLAGTFDLSPGQVGRLETLPFILSIQGG